MKLTFTIKKVKLVSFNYVYKNNNKSFQNVHSLKTGNELISKQQTLGIYSK